MPDTNKENLIADANTILEKSDFSSIIIIGINKDGTTVVESDNNSYENEYRKRLTDEMGVAVSDSGMRNSAIISMSGYLLSMQDFSERGIKQIADSVTILERMIPFHLSIKDPIAFLKMTMDGIRENFPTTIKDES